MPNIQDHIFYLNGKKLKLVESIDFPKDLKFFDEKFGKLIFFDEFVQQIYETQILFKFLIN